MKILIKVTLILWLSIVHIVSGYSQDNNSANNPLQQSELELKSLIDRISQSSDKKIMIELNGELVAKFYNTFQSKEALTHPFSTLYAISDITNKEKDFRVITWEMGNEKSQVNYYGIISYISNNQLYTFILSDSSKAITNAEKVKLSPDKWYGSLYYDIKRYKHRSQEWIILLGINRNETLIKKKVIEVIKVGEDLTFGADVFEIPKKSELMRKIYSYAVEADMSIWFDTDEDRILLDHLSPLSSMHTGKAEYYVPDLSFDSFTFYKGKFNYKGDVDARMEKNLKDRYFEMELPKQEKVY